MLTNDISFHGLQCDPSVYVANDYQTSDSRGEITAIYLHITGVCSVLFFFKQPPLLTFSFLFKLDLKKTSCHISIHFVLSVLLIVCYFSIF